MVLGWFVWVTAVGGQRRWREGHCGGSSSCGQRRGRRRRRRGGGRGRRGRREKREGVGGGRQGVGRCRRGRRQQGGAVVGAVFLGGEGVVGVRGEVEGGGGMPNLRLSVGWGEGPHTGESVEGKSRADRHKLKEGREEEGWKVSQRKGEGSREGEAHQCV